MSTNLRYLGLDVHAQTIAVAVAEPAAGGWKTEEVLVTSYQQADAETIRNVVLHPTHRIVSRLGGSN